MPLERKEVYVGTLARKNEEDSIRSHFCWKYVDDKHVGRSHAWYAIYERNTNILNYEKIAKLDNEYFNLKAQKKVYYPITDSPEMFLLILLFIFPFVLYCIYKSNQKSEIEAHNLKIEKRLKEIIKEADKLLGKE